MQSQSETVTHPSFKKELDLKQSEARVTRKLIAFKLEDNVFTEVRVRITLSAL